MIGSPKLIREHGLSEKGLQELDAFQGRFEGLLDQIAGVVVTPRQNIRLALLGLFARGHILLEDLTGVGVTLLAKTIVNRRLRSCTAMVASGALVPSTQPPTHPES